MSCDHLVCATCAGPVVEGRCATCRAARADLHRNAGLSATQFLAVLVALAVLFALLAAAHPGL